MGTAEELGGSVRDEFRSFCPLLHQECRRDCAWVSRIIEPNEDGMTEHLVCALASIADYIMGLDGYETY